MEKRFTDYDPFASIYNTHWGDCFHDQSLPVVTKLLLNDLPKQASVLDLCCGTGHMSEKLAACGYRVTGLDGSAQMLRYAKERLPHCAFLLADARQFQLEETVDAVICTFDSLNHVMSAEDLQLVFERTFQALHPGGWFLFDVNREEAYRELWVQSFPLVEDDMVQITRGSYDEIRQIARCDITLFRFEDVWRRSDFSLEQRFHSHPDIEAGLTAAGFEQIQHYDAAADLNMYGDIGYGRSFYKCRRPPLA